jgi:hypothetical protein
MGTKFTSQSASGYNSVPPADDGTVSEANKGKWATIKTKLADPIKTLVDAINTALVAHFNVGPTAISSNTTLGASHYNQIIQVSGSGVTLTLTDAATLAAGWFCEIHSTDSSNSTTIARATGADTINGATANYTLYARGAIKVFVNAAGTGFEIKILINPLGDNTIQSADAGAAAGPVVTLDRNSATPAASDVLGAIPFKGRDSGAGTDTYAQIQAEIVDPTATSEDGKLAFQTAVAGTLATRGYVGQGVVLGAPTGGDKGSGTGNFASGAYDNNQRIFSNNSRFTSASQTITSAGTLTLAHGLGTKPVLIQLALTNVNAGAGYSTGDEVYIGSGPQTSAVDRGAAVYSDATNVYITMGGAAEAFMVIHKTTGAVTPVTNGDWTLKVYAWG